MTNLFTFARTTAVAALALGAGALLIPEPAEARAGPAFRRWTQHGLFRWRTRRWDLRQRSAAWVSQALARGA